MKTLTFALSGFIITSFIFSCQKEDITDPAQLQLDIESCKPKDKKDLYIGKEHQGGIIFYLDETGKHGLIMAKEDLGPAPWGCYGTSIPEAQSISDGKANTRAILRNCSERGIAARLCHKYVVYENGEKYDNWYMPSMGEVMSIMAALKSSSGFCTGTRWTSTEAAGSFQARPIDPAYNAFLISFACAVPNPDSYMTLVHHSNKSNSLPVRPIRKF